MVDGGHPLKSTKEQHACVYATKQWIAFPNESNIHTEFQVVYNDDERVTVSQS